MNPSADALRVALLGIGAIHYASNLRDTGKEMVRRAIMEPSGARSDAALGAGTALATIDIFFGGSEWGDNFARALQMIGL
jgi:hypothetical protein